MLRTIFAINPESAPPCGIPILVLDSDLFDLQKPLLISSSFIQAKYPLGILCLLQKSVLLFRIYTFL